MHGVKRLLGIVENHHWKFIACHLIYRFIPGGRI